jgi:hypothetical protein
MAPDAEAIRTVTRHYPSLRAYQQVPFVAVLALMVAAGAMGWRIQGRLWLGLPLLLVALAGQVAVGRWYDRRFGTVGLAGTPGEAYSLVLVAFLIFTALQAISILAGLRVWLESLPPASRSEPRCGDVAGSTCSVCCQPPCSSSCRWDSPSNGIRRTRPSTPSC